MKSGGGKTFFFLFSSTPPYFCQAMSFDPATLTRIANLARIDIPAAQLSGLGDNMASILSLIDQLQAVDTRGVMPLSHPLSVIGEMPLRLRADVVTTPDLREACLANAPQTEHGLFLVPKVIE